MPRLKFRGSESEGWQPLPAATYNFQIDSVEETTSRNNNPQVKVAAHVMDGPHGTKKVTIWYALTEKSGWKFKQLLDACGVEYTEEETGEVTDTGKPVFDMDVELDDLAGCAFQADVTTEEYNGKDQNRFNNERPIDGSEQASAGSNGQQTQSQGAQQQQQQPQAQGGGRRRRVAP